MCPTERGDLFTDYLTMSDGGDFPGEKRYDYVKGKRGIDHLTS